MTAATMLQPLAANAQRESTQAVEADTGQAVPEAAQENTLSAPDHGPEAVAAVQLQQQRAVSPRVDLHTRRTSASIASAAALTPAPSGIFFGRHLHIPKGRHTA
jgi:hypothetical protein